MTDDATHPPAATRDAFAGAAFIVAHAMWGRSEIPAGMRQHADQATFDQVRAFHARVIARGADEPLIVCRGMSCRMNGAETFHARLREALTAAGCATPWQDVHCLGHCMQGPNIRLGDHTLIGQTGEVVNEARPWRSVDSGPQVVSERAPVS